MVTIQGMALVGGAAAGELVLSREPFSFFGGFDPATGKVIDPRSDVYGADLRDKIFAYPYGKGSSSTAGVILEALYQGTAPKAIINIDAEKILAVGIIVAETMFQWNLPIICLAEADYNVLKSGMLLVLDGGTVCIQDF